MFFSALSGMKLLMKTVQPTGKTHPATVIFFNGSGDTGHNLIEWIRYLLAKDMEFPHIKVMFPTAPVQPYTALDGQLSNVWFDHSSISIEAHEKRSSLAAIYTTVNDLIKSEIGLGIPAERIVVGGFSMGGALAIHTAYHLNTDLAGAFGCSAFLIRQSIVYDSLVNKTKPGDKLPELLMFHGDRDTLVPAAWGEETFQQLTKLGVKGNFHTLRNTLHELKKRELLDLQEWLSKLLPPLQTDLQNKL